MLKAPVSWRDRNPAAPASKRSASRTGEICVRDRTDSGNERRPKTFRNDFGRLRLTADFGFQLIAAKILRACRPDRTPPKPRERIRCRSGVRAKSCDHLLHQLEIFSSDLARFKPH